MRKITNEELGRLTVEEFRETEKIPVIVVADEVRSLNNIGSMFRTCDAFAVEKLILCGISATPPNKEIHKTAIGAEFSMEWEYYERTVSAVAALKQNGHTIIAVEQVENAVMLDDFKVEAGKKYAVIFGNEVNGVAQEVVDLCDGAIEIPQFGTKHSLNVSVATGVVIWEIAKQYKI